MTATVDLRAGSQQLPHVSERIDYAPGVAQADLTNATAGMDSCGTFTQRFGDVANVGQVTGTTTVAALPFPTFGTDSKAYNETSTLDIANTPTTKGEVLLARVGDEVIQLDYDDFTTPDIAQFQLLAKAAIDRVVANPV